jgi:hypothetical protein
MLSGAAERRVRKQQQQGNVLHMSIRAVVVSATNRLTAATYKQRYDWYARGAATAAVFSVPEWDVYEQVGVCDLHAV